MSAPNNATLSGLTLKSVKADLVRETVTLVFTAKLNDEMSIVRPTLQHYHTFGHVLTLAIQPQVTQLPIQTFGDGTEGDPFA